MPDQDFAGLFAGIRGFDWNPRKREGNLSRHKIDFDDVKEIFDDYTYVRRSDRHGEIRYQIFGYIHGREIAVAFTLRGDVCWLISARRANHSERRKFYEGLPR